MSRILTISPGSARGMRKIMFQVFKRQYGGIIPGIFKILSVDLKLGKAAGKIYQHLHMRKKSPMSRIQREMLATVVNGLIGGAP
ncbi:hypothetical protein GF337_08620 [candidate division KSB1 bacterium]|nr:hypothetical protein [candidate division KSB1 bacterium]